MKSTSLDDVRLLFDDVIAPYPEMRSFIAADANIVHCADFESAIVKIQREQEQTLTESEKLLMRPFCLVDEVAVNNNIDDDIDFASAIIRQKRRKINNTRYKNMFYALPTSNDVERLFSKSNFMIQDRRLRADVMNLEAQIFLHMNESFWDLKMFFEAKRNNSQA